MNDEIKGASTSYSPDLDWSQIREAVRKYNETHKEDLEDDIEFY